MCVRLCNLLRKILSTNCVMRSTKRGVGSPGCFLYVLLSER